MGNGILTPPCGKPFGEVTTPESSARLAFGLALAAIAAPLRQTAATRAASSSAPADDATSRIHHVP